MTIPFDVNSSRASGSLKGIGVLIVTDSGRVSADEQGSTAAAAHAAGVHLFVPADWDDHVFYRSGVWHAAVYAAADRVDIRTCAFFSIHWPKAWPFFGFDLQAGKITIQGDGTGRVAMTARDDVAQALTTFSRGTLEAGKFCIQGDCMVHFAYDQDVPQLKPVQSLLNEFNRASAWPLEILTTGRAALQEMSTGYPKSIVYILLLGVDQGLAEHKLPLANGLYPAWKSKTAPKVLLPMLPQ